MKQFKRLNGTAMPFLKIYLFTILNHVKMKKIIYLMLCTLLMCARAYTQICPSDLVLDISNGNDTVTAVNAIISSAELPDNSTVIYKAGIRIKLDSDFSSGTNTAFCAKIEQCPGQNPYASAPISGRIADESGVGIPDVNICIADQPYSYLTDKNGYFWITDPVQDSTKIFITAKKDGYISGSKTYFHVGEGGMGYVEIWLISSTPIGSVPANTGGTITLNDGATVSLPPNSAQTEDGSLYTGNINVVAKWLNPDSGDFPLLAPGELEGIDETGAEVLLLTAGVIVVELIADNGDHLDLADGATATLTVPISASIIDVAPDTIPLWNFDHEQNIWIIDGIAVRQGNSYIAVVTHFSHYNFDLSAGSCKVRVYITVVNSDGEPMEGIYGQVSCCDGYNTKYFHTNSNGKASGAIPKDEPITFLFKAACACDVYIGTTVGPFTENTNITFTIPSYLTTKVSGRLVNCDGDPVNDGYVYFKFDEDRTSPLNVNADGTFSQVLMSCFLSEPAMLIAYDRMTDIESLPTPVYIGGGTVEDLGDIEVCD